MTSSLDKISIKGFKSIRNLEDFELRSLNILIGANGAGKSNFIEFFRLLRAMMELPLPGLKNPTLKTYIADGGGSDDFLFNGPKETSEIEASMMFGENGYRFALVPTSDENMVIHKESRYYSGGTAGWWGLGSGQSGPELLKEVQKKNVMGWRISNYIYEAIDSWKIYHFHDTSKLSPMRRGASDVDNAYLRFDAENIAPYLLRLRTAYPTTYQQILDTIQMVVPFFKDFLLKEDTNEKVRLLWNQKGSDHPLKAHHLSDGTIRFICLATALLQPVPPSTILLDEPELGLHPFAIEILAELIKAASEKSQIIVSTQSPALVDFFAPEDVIVVNRKEGATCFRRLDSQTLSEWLREYLVGELWRKNVVEGGPSIE